ncbi:MAG: hypothetical protein ACLST1_11060 [[Eubacterium] siraeum]
MITAPPFISEPVPEAVTIAPIGIPADESCPLNIQARILIKSVSEITLQQLNNAAAPDSKNKINAMCFRILLLLHLS